MDPILAYTPSELVGILQKYRLDYGYKPMATIILGKFLYYIKNKNFQNTFPGRQAVSLQIAKDLKAQNLGTVSPENIFSLITMAKVYVDLDNKKPIQERGPLTTVGKVGREVKYVWQEGLDKAARGGTAIKSGLDPTQVLPSPTGIYQTAGLVAITGFILFYLYKKLGGRTR